VRVYLSWSGHASYGVASALRDFLPSVLQTTQPWLSSQDVRSGESWVTEFNDAVKSTELAILCVTAENLDSPWFMFEAGMLSKKDLRLCLYLLDVAPGDVPNVLAQFQTFTSTQEDTLRLLQLMNRMQPDHALPESMLDKSLALWWRQLDAKLTPIRRDTADSRPSPPTETPGNVVGEIRRLASLVEQVSERVAQVSDRLYGQTVPTPATGTRMTPPPGRPRVFIGSSTEGLPVARALQANLNEAAEVKIWDQDVYVPMKTTIETLVDAQAAYDFAIIVMTPDDILSKRGTTSAAPRDNLIFELGLFTGALGRGRTFLVCNGDKEIELPSDLDGVSRVKYYEHSDGNLRAATGPCSQRILQAMGLA
jgi:predicted nucleotide-binding protein